MGPHGAPTPYSFRAWGPLPHAGPCVMGPHGPNRVLLPSVGPLPHAGPCVIGPHGASARPGPHAGFNEGRLVR